MRGCRSFSTTFQQCGADVSAAYDVCAVPLLIWWYSV